MFLIWILLPLKIMGLIGLDWDFPKRSLPLLGERKSSKDEFHTCFWIMEFFCWRREWIMDACAHREVLPSWRVHTWAGSQEVAWCELKGDSFPGHLLHGEYSSLRERAGATAVPAEGGQHVLTFLCSRSSLRWWFGYWEAGSPAENMP